MSVPIGRFAFASTSADEAWDMLSRMYTRARPHTCSPQAALTVDSAAAPQVAVDHVTLHAAQGAFTENPDQVNIISVLTGAISVNFGRHGAARHLPGDSYLYLPDRPADLNWDTISALTVRLPLSVVARTAAEDTGLDPAALRFTSMRPLTPDLTRLWLNTARLLWDHLSTPDTLASQPMVMTSLLQTASIAALSVFPNTAMTRGYVPGPGDTRPAVIRRATAYIDAHAGLPITVTDIAHAASTTARALRDGFRRHLDTTPTAYLRRARLNGAHHQLVTADPATTTVRAIAASWGFTNLHRFTTAYHTAYGVNPQTNFRQ